jgi:hypothetical protein
MRRLSLPSERFEALASYLSKFASGYLERLPRLPTYPSGITGLETERLFAGDAPAEGMGDEAFNSLTSIFEHSRPASPRFFGYVFGSGNRSECWANSQRVFCIRMLRHGDPHHQPL